jgi:hypothetical protein
VTRWRHIHSLSRESVDHPACPENEKRNTLGFCHPQGWDPASGVRLTKTKHAFHGHDPGAGWAHNRPLLLDRFGDRFRFVLLVLLDRAAAGHSRLDAELRKDPLLDDDVGGEDADKDEELFHGGGSMWETLLSGLIPLRSESPRPAVSASGESAEPHRAEEPDRQFRRTIERQLSQHLAEHTGELEAMAAETTGDVRPPVRQVCSNDKVQSHFGNNCFHFDPDLAGLAQPVGILAEGGRPVLRTLPPGVKPAGAGERDHRAGLRFGRSAGGAM